MLNTPGICIFLNLHSSNRWIGSCYFAAFLCSFIFSPRAIADEKSRQIELASKGNSGAIERLSQISFQARIVEGENGKGGVYIVHYWRSGEKWRLTTKGLSSTRGGNNASLDICSDGNETRSITTRMGKNPWCVLRTPTSVPRPSIYDPWGGGMFTIPCSNRELTLSELLAQNEVLKVEKEGQEAGSDLIFHFKLDEQVIALWVSPRYNYLIRKSSSPPGSEDRYEREVQFEELEQGVFFPIRVESVRIRNGSRMPFRIITYTDVVLNKPHPTDIFDLRFPRGAKLFNEIRNQTYDTDENGQPIGKVTPVTAAPGLALSPVDGSSGIEQLTETKEETRSITRYILPASLGILTTAVLLWSIRRGRTSADSPTPST